MLLCIKWAYGTLSFPPAPNSFNRTLAESVRVISAFLALFLGADFSVEVWVEKCVIFECEDVADKGILFDVADKGILFFGIDDFKELYRRNINGIELNFSI